MRVLHLCAIFLLSAGCLEEDKIVKFKDGSDNRSSFGYLKAKYMASAGSHSCAIREDNTLKCWGSNSSGQLGLGDNYPRGVNFAGVLAENSTVQLTTGPEGVLQVSAGSNSTCALFDHTADGLPNVLKCWGYNNYGSLGQNNTTVIGRNGVNEVDQLMPIDLGAGAGEVKMIASGQTHVCALVEGVDADTSLDDQVVCWGNGQFGRLGRGSGDNAGDDPTRPVVPATSPETRFVPLSTAATSDASRDAYPISIGTGYLHSCAIMRPKTVGAFDGSSAPDGEHDFLRCWGANQNGQLGLDSTAVTNIGAGAGNHANEFSDPNNIAQIGANLTATGDVKAIDLGRFHTCAILDSSTQAPEDDVLRCWGNNPNGQLGYDPATITNIDSNAEFAALTNVPLGTNKYPKAVFTEYHYTCAVVGDSFNDASPDELKCWGTGSLGRLGSGSDADIVASDNNLAVALPGMKAPTTVAGIGISFFCSLLDSGGSSHEVACFGHNAYGQLGNPTIGNVGDEPNEMGDASKNSTHDVIGKVID